MDESEPDPASGARMELEPDAIHEGTGELAVDCPQCGATVSVLHIVEDGHCPGYVDSEATEVEGDDERLDNGGCGATLSLELVWDA